MLEIIAFQLSIKFLLKMSNMDDDNRYKSEYKAVAKMFTKFIYLLMIISFILY